MSSLLLIWLVVTVLLVWVSARLLHTLGLRPAFAPSLHFLLLFLAFWAIRTSYVALAEFELLANYLTFATSSAHVLGVTLIAVLSLLCFLTGVVTTHVLSPTGSAGVRWHVPNTVPGQTFAVLSLLAILGLSIWVFASFGGVVNYVLNWGIFRFGDAARGTSYLVFVLHSAIVFAWYLHYCLLSDARRSAAKSVSYWLLIAATYLMLLTLGDRSPALLLAGAMMLSRTAHRQPRSIASDPAIIGFALFVVALIAYRNLRFLLSQGFFAAPGSDRLLVYVLGQISGDFLSVDLTYMLFEVVPLRHEHLWSASLVDLPASLIPRAWWPAKPDVFGPGKVLGVLFPSVLRSQSYVAPDILGDLYLNFSIPGVFAGMLLLGSMLGRADVIVLRQQPERALAVILLSLVFSFWLIKGALGGAISRSLLTYLPPLLAISFVARLRFVASGS